MGIIEDFLDESIKLFKDVKAGKLDGETATLRHKLLSNIQHGAKLLIEVEKLRIIGGKPAINRLYKKNVIGGEGQAVPVITNHEIEYVRCPIKHNELIQRHECLDYSGSNFDDCNGCQTGIETKDLLLDGPMYTA